MPADSSNDVLHAEAEILTSSIRPRKRAFPLAENGVLFGPQMTQGYIDIHCHLLAGVDDGPATVDIAVELVNGLAEVGFSDFYPTPHQRLGFWTPETAALAEAAAQLDAALKNARCAATVNVPAAENMWDSLFLERQMAGQIPCYPGTRAFLFEVNPREVPPQLMDVLFRIQLEGRLPVMAHVERYAELVKSEATLEQLAGKAALLVNLTSLGGQAGRGQRRQARRLVQAGFAHAAASDAHRPEDIPYVLSGLEWLKREVGPSGVQSLLVRGPQAILRGEIPSW